MIFSSHNPREITQIGHYEIRDCIGRGGMGLVYLALDTRLGRQVAIKCLRSELYEHTYRERFKREALLLAKLNHPNIVQIYDFIEADDQLALVMEYVDGRNLQQHLREQVVTFTQRLHWLTQIAYGLAVAHDAGIIHRDLKAENILINKRNEAKISDLGIAKSQDNNATLTDHVAGSYCSMSPEQAVGEELDFKSDLFSLGILAYQLLCGAHPFGDTNNKLQLMQRIISHPPISPTKSNPDLPAEISTLLGQLLSKNPDNRPANTRWVAAQFEKFSLLDIYSPHIDDNTQELPHPEITKKYTAATGRINTRKHTQEHPTFETRFESAQLTFFRRIKKYLAEHSIVSSVIALLVLTITGAMLWQLQPKQPHYVAVLAPLVSSSVMQESQQELIKGAVYDSIQQSILQLDGYYLIPGNEIADVNAAHTKEGLEIIRRATAADELIASDIKCKLESCSITLSRLIPEAINNESRLRVRETKTIEVLTDNYLSIAEIIQNDIAKIYSKNILSNFEALNEAEYAVFLQVNQALRNSGPNKDLLETIDRLQQTTKNVPAVKTLYKEIALDMYYATNDSVYLDKLDAMLNSGVINSNSYSYLSNIFYLDLARNNFSSALGTIDKIEKIGINKSLTFEYLGYLSLLKNEYSAAIDYYNRALKLKPTTNSFHNLSLAYWYSGNYELSKFYLKATTDLSPNFYKSHLLRGAIALSEGDTQQAIKSFGVVVDQRSNDMFALSNLGLSYLLQENYNNAKEMFGKALTIAPENPTFLLNLADAENLSHNTDGANRLYKKVIDLQRTLDTRDSLRNKAQSFAHLGELTSAIINLQKLQSVDSQGVDTMYTSALVYTLSNDKTSALVNTENALKGNMSSIWFNFSWFDKLCSDNTFIALMKKYGNPNRCDFHI